MMPELRPIGTEFDYCYPPSATSSNPCFTIFRYRVKAHAEVALGFSGSETDFLEGRGKTFGSQMAKTLDVVDSRTFHPTTYVMWFGQLRPVPSKECADLLDEGWRALYRYANPS